VQSADEQGIIVVVLTVKKRLYTVMNVQVDHDSCSTHPQL